jgi:hypothetical protein
MSLSVCIALIINYRSIDYTLKNIFEIMQTHESVNVLWILL